MNRILLKYGYIFLLSFLMAFPIRMYAGKTETKRVTVGDTFTVYTTVHSYTKSVTWSWDTGVLELQGSLSGSSTSATFKVKKATPTVGITVQAITWYFQNGTTATGLNKDVDRFNVFATDNTTVSLDNNSFSLIPNQRVSLTATPSNANYSGSYKWNSTNTNAVTFTGSGKTITLKAVADGSSTISVTLDNGNKATCVVTVETPKLESITIQSPMEVYVGQTKDITYSTYPQNAPYTAYWYSKDASIVKVGSASVTGVKKGTTTVYCKADNGVVSNYCTVNVTECAPSLITCSPKSTSLPIGGTQQLSYVLSPSYSISKVKWSTESGKENIVSVTTTGLVTAVAPGKENIIVTTDNGKTDICTVTVKSPEIESITIPSSLDIYVGNHKDIEMSLLPANALFTGNWYSDDESIAIAESGVVTGKTPGTTDIYCRAQNGVTSNKCKVSVIDSSPTSIYCSHSDVTLSVQDTIRLSYSLSPSYAISEVTWTTESGSDDIVSVSQDGLVTAVSTGQENVIATTENGLTATCKITVTNPKLVFVIWAKDGKRTAYLFEDEPAIKYSDKMFILSSKDSRVEYIADDIQKFTIADNNKEDFLSSVKSVQNYEESSIYYSNGRINIMGCKPKSHVGIFDISGLLLGDYTCDTSGRVSLRVDDYPKGILLIKTDSKTYKMIKK